MTRVERLRNKLMAMDDAGLFYERTALCAEAWELHRWELHAVQTARILAHVLEHVSVVIDDDDLLVGRAPERVPDGAEELFLADNARFSGTLGQWSLPDACREAFGALLSARRRAVMSIYGAEPGGWRNGHTTPSWPTVIEVGLAEIGRRAAARLAGLDADDEDSVRQAAFLQSVAIAAEALIALAGRYADEVGRRAAVTDDEARRQELLEIERICRHVPARPARTFHEGVQAVWLVQLVLSTVIGARDFAPGRFDQYLYPLYERDRAAGRLTRERAGELVDCFFLKLNENIGRGPKRSLCVNSVQYLILGGQTADGEDATNDLSFLCLEAVERLRLRQPTVVVRYHDRMRPDFFRRACEVIALGTGNPSIFNDHTMVPALGAVGVPLEEARGYAVIGCANPNLPGREGALNDHRLNLAKCLELALNDGVCPVTGRDTGVRTGPPGRFATFEALLAAFFRHVDEQVACWIARNDLFDRVCATCVCDPLLSALVDGCIERATDCYAGGAAHFHNPYQAAGLATVTDALAAIRTAVYEERLLPLAELSEVLRADFSGREDLRQRLLRECPKFGNDEERTDALARRIADRFAAAVLSRPTRWGNGRGNWPGIYSFGQNHVHMGRATGATADGRHAGEPISFNLSPSAGCARCGPTAEARSVAAIDFRRISGGGTYDLKLDPASARQTDRLEALLRTYLELGGMQVQVNVVDRATLLDAQAHPERHADLLVRVTGYSAPFTALGRDVQDDIIARHQHVV